MQTDNNQTQTPATATRPTARSMELSSKVELPKDGYVLRVIGEEFGPSKNSGNNMTTVELEIASPSVVTDKAGNQIQCGGFKFKTYFPTQHPDAKTQEEMRGRLFDLWEAIGEKENTNEVDFNNPPLFFKKAIDAGKPILVDAVLYGKRKVETNAQGQPIKMGGKEVVSYQVQLDKIYGVHVGDVSESAGIL